MGEKSRYNVWEVWVDTRNTRGHVVQYRDSHFGSFRSARARKRRINTQIDRFPNMVAWLEGPHESAYVVNNREAQRNSQAKLTPMDVDEIRARRANGELVSLLAAEFLVHRMTISDIVNGKAWAA